MILSSGKDVSVMDTKANCPFGDNCYRTSKQHLEEYSHPGTDEKRRQKSKLLDEMDAGSSKNADPPKKKVKTEHQTQMNSNSDFGDSFQRIYLTTVKGIDPPFNDPSWTCTMKKLLSPEMGNLQSSIQFNYMFDIPWIVEQYPLSFRDKPMLIVHGYKGTSNEGQEIREEASKFSHVSLITARLDMPYGTHHTKMMILRYDNGLRIVIHTCNLIPQDWHQKTQGVWISPVFPKCTNGTDSDSVTGFKRDLVEYLRHYRNAKLDQIANEINLYDMSSAHVSLIASIPGRHTGNQLDSFGHRKLRSLLKKHCSVPDMNNEWPIIGQFSSIGSLGTTSESWLTGEFVDTLSSPSVGMKRKPHLNLIFPSVDNVRMSLEGWNGGGSLPYSSAVANKQAYLHKLFHIWKSDSLGRTHAMPHIKTYTRTSPDLSQAAWLLITSANLSKAAWGALEKQSSQLMIRSYELGVLFLPKFVDPSAETFTILHNHDSPPPEKSPFIFLPYDLPLEEYSRSDQPWTYDNPQTGLLDRFGQKRC